VNGGDILYGINNKKNNKNNNIIVNLIKLVNRVSYSKMSSTSAYAMLHIVCSDPLDVKWKSVVALGKSFQLFHGPLVVTLSIHLHFGLSTL
jgi:hypothetical protein